MNVICDKRKMTIKEIELKTGMNCQKYLTKRYLEEYKSSTFISKEIFGRETGANRIIWLLRYYGISLRSNSDRVKSQWVNNDERRNNQSKRAKINLVDSEGREKLKAIMKTEEYRKKSSKLKKGSNNPMYGRIGELSPAYKGRHTKEERDLIRKSYADVRWRKEVFERDKYICQCCGYGKGHILVAHHMNSWHWDINGRCDVNNGITLCEPCHIKFHDTYGYKNNNKYQLKTFLSKQSIQ